MYKKVRSFYSELSLIFLFVIILFGTGILIITYTSSGKLFDEVEQVLNREYATSIANELKPFLEDGFSENRIKDAIHYMMVLNPMVEIYVLDSSGIILSFFTHPGDTLILDRIDTEPILDLLENRKKLPILGDDPRKGESRKPFSAAKLGMGSDTGYIYVILRGENYDISVKGISRNYYLDSGIFLLIMAIVGTTVTGLLLFFILTRRIRLLTKTVSEFRKGDYTKRVVIAGKDEISYLGQTFNEMATSIEKSTIEKNDILSSISHDLRSPITSIRGYVETMIYKENNLSENNKMYYLNIILKNISNLQKLVDSLFELAKLEYKQIKLNKEHFDLGELCQDIVIKLNNIAQQKKITIEFKEPKTSNIFFGDIGMMERAITNIVENGINYTDNNGLIQIEINKSDKEFILKISDNGIGINPADLNRIFNRFYRGVKEKNSGTGLGLAIVKNIITLHKGHIEVKSNPGEGSDFTIYLPII